MLQDLFGGMAEGDVFEEQSKPNTDENTLCQATCCSVISAALGKLFA